MEKYIVNVCLVTMLLCVNVVLAATQNDYSETYQTDEVMYVDYNRDRLLDEFFIDNGALYAASINGEGDVQEESFLVHLPEGTQSYALHNFSKGGLGYLDLVFITNDAIYVSVYSGRHFREPTLWLYLGDQLREGWQVSFADLNGDDRMDLQVSNSSMAGDYLSTGGRFFPWVERLDLEFFGPRPGQYDRVLVSSQNRSYPHLLSHTHLAIGRQAYNIPDWVREINMTFFHQSAEDRDGRWDVVFEQFINGRPQQQANRSAKNSVFDPVYSVRMNSYPIYMYMPPEDPEDCDDLDDNCD